MPAVSTICCNAASALAVILLRVLMNLYAVSTPIQDGQQQSKIEDLFDAQSQSTFIEGETFSGENDFDTNSHYSKCVFAYKVIEPMAETIDFSGFRPLLSKIDAVIDWFLSLNTLN